MGVAQESPRTHKVTWRPEELLQFGALFCSHPRIARIGIIEVGDVVLSLFPQRLSSSRRRQEAATLIELRLHPRRLIVGSAAHWRASTDPLSVCVVLHSTTSSYYSIYQSLHSLHTAVATSSASHLILELRYCGNHDVDKAFGPPGLPLREYFRSSSAAHSRQSKAQK